MTWKIKGKIGCHFPNSSAPNQDTYKIVYSSDGVQSNLQEIKKVYFLTPADASYISSLSTIEAQLAELATGKYDVWERYWEEPPSQKKLLAGDQAVCIEFIVPNGPNDNDIQLSNLAIYTADNESSNTVNFGIIHESGLVVYKAVEDSIDHTVSPKYELNGDLRKIQSINNVVLKKGLKYYIHYTNANNTFKPAYFSGLTGNYLNWTHSSLQDKSVANLNSASLYLGVVTDAAVWLAANENDFMISEIGQGGLNNTDAYIRNGTFNNASIIGENQQTLPAAEKDKLLKLNAGDGFMYIGNNYVENYSNVLENQKIYSKNSTLDNTKYKGLKSTAKGILDDLEQYDYCIYNGTSTSTLTNNVIYKKMQSLVIDSDYTTKGTQSSHDPEDDRNIIRLSYNADGNKHIAVNGYMYWGDRTGNVYQLKSGYSYDFNRQGNTDVGFDATTMVSADMVQNRIYYVSTAGQCPAYGNWLNAGLYCWTGSTFSSISDYNAFASYFIVTSFADAVQVVQLNNAVNYFGVLSDLAKTHYDGAYISNTIRSQTVESDKKFYLEINGEEK